MSNKQPNKQMRASLLELEMEKRMLQHALEMVGDSKESKTISNKLRECTENYIKAEYKFIKKMSLGRNILELDSDWVAVRVCDSNGNMSLGIHPISSDNFFVIQRDGRTGRELSPKELETLVPSCVTTAVSLQTDKKLISQADDLVMSLRRKDSPPTREDAVEGDLLTLVSRHTGIRYIQRFLGIQSPNESLESSYLNSNREQVEEAIIDMYKNSTLIWSDEDVNYYLHDEDNVVFVVGDDNTIITMYEEKFGFSKSINRTIVLNQVKEIERAFNNMRDKEEEYNNVTDRLQSNLNSIDSDIEVLKKKIEALNSEKGVINAEIKMHGDKVQVAKKEYSVEFSKLFKPWNGGK